MPDSKDRALTVDLLKAVPLFSSLDKKHLQTLAKTAADHTYEAGTVIVPQGATGVGFYLIADGQVAVDKSGKTVATLGPGQFFGEMALLDDQPRSASVRAVGRTRCLVIDRWEFWASVANEPEVLRTLLRETVRRLRQAAPTPGD